LLQVLLRDFGANPDQIIELSDLAEEYHLPDQDEYLSLASAKAKAKSAPAHTAGYRGMRE
jgi:hypothetical protein